MNAAEKSNAIATALATTAMQNHKIGDNAAKLSAKAAERKDQRRWNAINLAARATATAAETSLMLASLVANGMHKRGKGPSVGSSVMLRLLSDSASLIDDRAAEVAILSAYKPQYRKTK